MTELHGKGWRVLGYFIWMLGSGVVLDGDSRRIAALLLTVGLVLFLIGTWQSWVRGLEWEKGRAGEEPRTPHRH